MKPVLYLAMMSLALTVLQAIPLDDPEAWETDTTPVQQLVQDDELVLPAGTQLYRLLAAENITLRIISQPAFSSEPEEVAVLEFGSSALAFTKENDEGRITLVTDGLDPLTLPQRIALDESDRSLEPLIMELTQRGEVLFLTHRQQSQQISTHLGPAQIILSAGVSQDWAIQSLQVTFEPLLVSDETDITKGRSESSDGFAPGIERSANRGGGLSVTSNSEESSDSSVEKASSSGAKVSQRAVRLEVFTPPAVRRSRSAAVRAVLEAVNGEREL